MSTSPIDRVLSCPNLPTLPGVAMKVLELTRDPKVSITRIAQTVQNDPALATKVLRTVNSSFYALQTPCPNISRAMSLLGLSTVKAIVLGFSLVDSTKALGRDNGFDMQSYWRRAVYSAAAARNLAIEAHACDPEEAFVGALLQDIGMLASFAALKDHYVAVLASAGDDHDDLPAAERDALQFDHAAVGGQLAGKWHLPPQIVACITHHHAPDKAPQAHARLAQVVGLATLAAAALTHPSPQRKLNAFIVGTKKQFGLSIEQSRALIELSAKGARELAKTLDLAMGASPDVTAILSDAQEQLLAAQVEMQREAVELKRNNEELARKNVTDGLTGAFNRAHFDRELHDALQRCRAARQPVSVIFLDADRFKSVNDTHGHQAGDAVLMEIASRLREVASRFGTFCRYGGEEFVVVVPAVGLDKARHLAEILRQVVANAPFDLARYDIPGVSLNVTISLGVACAEPAGPTADWTPEQLTHAADEAVYAAKRAGRNCVRTHADAAPAPAPAQSSAVLLVDPNPLTLKVLRRLLAAAPTTVAFAASAAEADAARTAAPRPFDAVILSLELPAQDLPALLARFRAANPTATVALCAVNPGDEARAAALGAARCLDAADLLADPRATIASLLSAAPGLRAA